MNAHTSKQAQLLKYFRVFTAALEGRARGKQGRATRTSAALPNIFLHNIFYYVWLTTRLITTPFCVQRHRFKIYQLLHNIQRNIQAGRTTNHPLLPWNRPPPPPPPWIKSCLSQYIIVTIRILCLFSYCMLNCCYDVIYKDLIAASTMLMYSVCFWRLSWPSGLFINISRFWNNYPW